MPFARPNYEALRAERKQINAEVLAKTRGRMATYGGATAGPEPKEDVSSSEAYRRAVAALPCINCCKVGASQAAHPNTGKGMGAKTDDRGCFPLCADMPGRRGCHSRFDQGALYSKETRRELEALWGKQTRAVIVGMGNWPKGLPMWEDA